MPTPTTPPAPTDPFGFDLDFYNTLASKLNAKQSPPTTYTGTDIQPIAALCWPVLSTKERQILRILMLELEMEPGG